MGAERMKWLTQQLVGQLVTIKMQDGGQFEGLVMARKPGDKLALELSQVRRKSGGKWKPKDKIATKKTETYELDKIVSLVASDVILQGYAPKPVNTAVFTDRTANRELQKLAWDPSAEFEGTALCFDDGTYQAGQFDQFAVNEKKFGVKSTYNFDDYSTVLDKTKMSKDQIRRAEEMAKEIESSNRGRGGHYDSTVGDWAADFDEEALHSAVIRESDPVSQQQLHKQQEEGKNQYVPPHLRKGGDPAAAQPQPTNGPTVAAPAGAVPVQAGNNAQAPVSTSVLNHHNHLQYRQEGQLQVRQDGGGAPLTPGAAVLPADCYNEGTAVAPQPSPPPPQAQRPAPAQQTSPAAQPSPVAPKQQAPATPAPVADPSKKQVNPKPAIVKPAAAGKSPSLPRQETTKANTKQKEIAEFMKSSQELDQLFKKRKPTPAAPTKAASKDDNAALNPNAQPYSQDEKEKQAPEPPPEPEWKPPLGEGKGEALCVQEKFICSFISNSIFKKLKEFEPKQGQGASPSNRLPIPGDGEAFKYEWKGDDHYWDEEEDQTGGREERPPTFTANVGQPGNAANQGQARQGMTPARVQQVNPHFQQQQPQQQAQPQQQQPQPQPMNTPPQPQQQTQQQPQQQPQQQQQQPQQQTPTQQQQPQQQAQQQAQPQPQPQAQAQAQAQAQPQAQAQAQAQAQTQQQPQAQQAQPQQQQAQQAAQQTPQQTPQAQSQQQQHLQQHAQPSQQPTLNPHTNYMPHPGVQQHAQQPQHAQQQQLQQQQQHMQTMQQQQQFQQQQQQQQMMQGQPHPQGQFPQQTPQYYQQPQMNMPVPYQYQPQAQQPQQAAQAPQQQQQQHQQAQQQQAQQQQAQQQPQFGQAAFTQSPAPPFQQQPQQFQQQYPQQYQSGQIQATPQQQGMYQGQMPQQPFNQQQHPFAGAGFPNQQYQQPQQQQQQYYHQQQQQQQQQQQFQGRPDQNMQYPQAVNPQMPGMSPGMPYAQRGQPGSPASQYQYANAAGQPPMTPPAQVSQFRQPA